MKKEESIKIPFIENKNEVPIININLAGALYTAVIDTGSETTLFDSSVKEFLSIIGRTPYELHTLSENHSVISCSAEAAVRMFDVSGKSFPVVVNGDIIDFQGVREHYNNLIMIIGSDTLAQLKAKVDYKEKCLIINDLSGK